MSWKIVIFAALAVLVVVLIAQNVEEVGVRILFWEMRMPLFLLLVVCAASSFGVGYLAARLTARRKPRREPGDLTGAGNVG